MRIIDHPIYGRGSVVTEPTVQLVNAVALTELIKGDASRIALAFSMYFLTTSDPEAAVFILQEGTALGPGLVVLTVQAPTYLMRYEEWGDVVGRRLLYLCNVGTPAVAVTPIRFEKA